MVSETYNRIFAAEAGNMVLKDTRKAGCVEWECPSNIALVKYWGKNGPGIPANPSISFTLSNCISRVAVNYEYSKGRPFAFDFKFDGKNHPAFNNRLKKYFQQISFYLPFLSHVHLSMESSNSFPHSAGIASSASAYGAIALALCSIEEHIFDLIPDKINFYRKASFLARLGSGSACRSVYGGVVLWGNTSEFSNSSDETAIPVTEELNPEFKHFRDSILIVYSGSKPLSSSEGHRLMEKHPYAASRNKQAFNNLHRTIKALYRGDMYEFIDIIENEALSLHALLMTSHPGYILMHPNTLEIIEKIRNYRHKSGLPVGFTLDAGANVHVLYPFAYRTEIQAFIKEQLLSYCENQQVIHDHVGNGPVKRS